MTNWVDGSTMEKGQMKRGGQQVSSLTRVIGAPALSPISHIELASSTSTIDTIHITMSMNMLTEVITVMAMDIATATATLITTNTTITATHSLHTILILTGLLMIMIMCPGVRSFSTSPQTRKLTSSSPLTTILAL